MENIDTEAVYRITESRKNAAAIYAVPKDNTLIDHPITIKEYFELLFELQGTPGTINTVYYEVDELPATMEPLVID
jgi:hypothetical protein